LPIRFSRNDLAARRHRKGHERHPRNQGEKSVAQQNLELQVEPRPIK
jgi:hypothetical protein